VMSPSPRGVPGEPLVSLNCKNAGLFLCPERNRRLVCIFGKMVYRLQLTLPYVETCKGAKV